MTATTSQVARKGRPYYTRFPAARERWYLYDCVQYYTLYSLRLPIYGYQGRAACRSSGVFTEN
ncbi:MAG TPA: hypothetical protein VIY29_23280 [Ktedonobacteraceae bacterium]